MMLRLGMRMTKVDPGAAESWVKKAINGGVLESNRDNLIINATDASGAVDYLTNGMSFILRVRTSTAGKISKTFFDFMNNNNDPILKLYVSVIKDSNYIGTKNMAQSVSTGYQLG